MLVFIINSVFAQEEKVDTIKQEEDLTFRYDALIIPTVLIGYGFIGLKSGGIKSLNADIRNKVKYNTKPFKIDDYSEYAPVLSVYALNAFGVKGKHNFKDRTIIIGTAYLIMGSTVFGLKKITGIERPDGSANTAFPSGHTATAFMGAEFLYQEYKDVSIWYGIAGYVVAAGTGYFRMYNDRHWFTDVVAGAGIGILSTKISYWLYPIIKEKIFKGKDKKVEGLTMPFYNGKEAGLNLVLVF